MCELARASSSSPPSASQWKMQDFSGGKKKGSVISFEHVILLRAVRKTKRKSGDHALSWWDVSRLHGAVWTTGLVYNDQTAPHITREDGFNPRLVLFCAGGRLSCRQTPPGEHTSSSFWFSPTSAAGGQLINAVQNFWMEGNAGCFVHNNGTKNSC